MHIFKKPLLQHQFSGKEKSFIARLIDLRLFPAQSGACPTLYQTLDSCTPSSTPLFLLYFLWVAQPCTVSNTTETSVFVLCWVWGYKEALGVWEKVVLI